MVDACLISAWAHTGEVRFLATWRVRRARVGPRACPPTPDLGCVLGVRLARVSHANLDHGGSTMLRKQITPQRPGDSLPFEGEIDIAKVATVQVSSEQNDHPIDHVFDHSRGPGAAVGLPTGLGSKP